MIVKFNKLDYNGIVMYEVSKYQYVRQLHYVRQAFNAMVCVTRVWIKLKIT